MSFNLKIINVKTSEEMSHRSRSRVESPEDQTERVSVFERLGRRRMGAPVKRSTEYINESDLRGKVSRKRRHLSPNRRSTSPKVKHPSSSAKKASKAEDKLDNKGHNVRSLVLPANARPESPTSTSRRPPHTSHKWDDDIDSEALERKRLELQKQLQELEKSGPSTTDDKHRTVADSHLLSDLKDIENSSSSSSIISSESSSTLKSLSKTESSENSEKKVVKSCAVREDRKSDKVIDNKKSEKDRTHVSSSITLKNVTHSEPSTRKSSEVKLDRHGNVRISLDELERQKRLRAERFGSAADAPPKSGSTEPKIIVTRDNSYSPTHKRSKDSGRHRNISDSSKADRNPEHPRDDYKYKQSSTRSKYDCVRSRSRSISSKRDDNRSKAGSERSVRTYLDSKPIDSRYSDRDNTSITSRHSRKRGGKYSRDQSPAHSSRSKLSVDRDSSIGSDFSRRSKSERMSAKSIDNLLTSHNTNKCEVKAIEIKVNDTAIEEMSPISADSSIPDVDIDSTQSDILVDNSGKNKSEENLSSTKEVKVDEESEDNFSEWSEDEDELLLKNDGFETMDEAHSFSSPFERETDPWIENNSSNKKKVESSGGVTAHNKDDALEAISDDELDAIIGESDPIDSTVDSRNNSSNRHVLDALDIDWGSLRSEAKTDYIPGSARKRFSAANVLMRIGFSQAFAGPEMTNKLIDFCQNELKEEFVPFKHPMAAIHSFITERLRERQQLFGADITHSAVLSGRKDLQIRKMFNKTNFKVFDDCSTTTPSTPTTAQPTTSLVNDSSVSSTNPIETHVSDIECF